MNVTIIKSKSRKRSIQISINKYKEITVKAPLKTTDKQIEQFLNERKEWVQKTLQKIPDYKRKQIGVGFDFLVFGKSLTLQHKTGILPKREDPFLDSTVNINTKYILFDGSELFYKGKNTESAVIQKHLIHFYKLLGKKYSQEKSEYFARLINKKFNRISIKDINSRWGSCSSKSNLNYNYRLFMAPLSVINYVIAHEVAHLKHQNHSKNFWNLVEQIYPNYKVQKQWLKKNGDSLSL